MGDAIRAHGDAASHHDKLDGEHHRRASRAHTDEANRIRHAMEKKSGEKHTELTDDEAFHVYNANQPLITKYSFSAARLAKDLKENDGLPNISNMHI